MVFQDKDTFPIKEENESNDLEYIKFGSQTPLKTLLLLLGGPLLSNLTNATYGMFDSMWISKSIGEYGLTVVSSCFLVEYIVQAFGNFINISVSSQISYLFGQKRNETAHEVVSDLFRFCLLIGFGVPLLFLPFIKSLIRWISSDDGIVNEGFKYLLPNIGCFVVPSIYLLLCGVLQGEGKTWYFGMIQVVSLCLNMLVFDPLFLLYFRTGVWGASLATVISQLIPTIFLFIQIKREKVTSRLTIFPLFRPFVPETYTAIKVGFSSFIMHLSTAFPVILMQKYVSLASKAIGQFDSIMALWNVLNRIYFLSMCIMMAITSAYLPSASYAFGGSLFSRILSLTLHSFWIATSWAVVCSIMMCIFPGEVAGIWSKGTDFLYWARKIIPNNFYTLSLCPMRAIATALLQAMKEPGKASMLSIVTMLIPIPIFSTIFYYTKKDDPLRIFRVFIISDIFSFIVSIFVAVKPLHNLVKLEEEKAVEEEDEIIDSL